MCTKNISHSPSRPTVLIDPVGEDLSDVVVQPGVVAEHVPSAHVHGAPSPLLDPNKGRQYPAMARGRIKAHSKRAETTIQTKYKNAH